MSDPHFDQNLAQVCFFQAYLLERERERNPRSRPQSAPKRRRRSRLWRLCRASLRKLWRRAFKRREPAASSRVAVEY
jgi:hypothetical protein